MVGCKEYNQSDFGVDHLVMSMYRVFSCVVGRGCLLWPVHFLGKTLLVLRVSRDKILQARLQQYVNRELPDVQAGFKKGRGTREQIANIHWIMKKQESSRKTSISAFLTMPKPLTVWITRNCVKFWKRWEYQPTWPASWETYKQVRKQQLELVMEQQDRKSVV